MGARGGRGGRRRLHRSRSRCLRLGAGQPARPPTARSATPRWPSCSPRLRRVRSGRARSGGVRGASGRESAGASPAGLGAAGVGRAVVVALASAAVGDPVGQVRDEYRAFTELRVHQGDAPRASRAEAATATTTGGSRSTSSPTTRSEASARATTTAPTSSSGARPRTSAKRTASSCRRWASSASSAARLLAVFLVAIGVGLRPPRARRRRTISQRPGPRRRGRRHVRRVVRPHERRLAASDSRAHRDRALLGRRACRSVAGGRGRRAPAGAFAVVVAVRRGCARRGDPGRPRGARRPLSERRARALDLRPGRGDRQGDATRSASTTRRSTPTTSSPPAGLGLATTGGRARRWPRRPAASRTTS